jgi:hypothetical protein
MILLLTLWPFAIIASAWIVVRWATANQPSNNPLHDSSDQFGIEGVRGFHSQPNSSEVR